MLKKPARDAYLSTCIYTSHVSRLQLPAGCISFHQKLPSHTRATFLFSEGPKVHVPADSVLTQHRREENITVHVLFSFHPRQDQNSVRRRSLSSFKICDRPMFQKHTFEKMSICTVAAQTSTRLRMTCAWRWAVRGRVPGRPLRANTTL